MRKYFRFPDLSPDPGKWVTTLTGSFKTCLVIFLVLVSTNSFAQVPDPNTSCTSGDLELVSAVLPPPNADPCACGGTRTLMLSIKNKTGSTRTSFAFWGTLKIYNSDGSEKSSTPITGCNGPIAKNTNKTLGYTITTLPFGNITFDCGESLVLTDLFLAWTDASPGSTCPLNPATINPKCGKLGQIQIVAGVDADFLVTDATCTAGGSIKVSPFGGVAPYKVKIGTDERTGIVAGGSTTFTNLPAGAHNILITDSRPCSVTKSRTVGATAAPTANAGSDFTKTCIANTSGQTIGEASEAGFTYSWAPATGLSATNVSNPTANPTSTTTYTVTKTNIATGCSDDDDVTVTVNTTAPTASAGADFTKTCVANTSGQTIGEANDAAFTYSWSPATGLSATNVSNPTANPASTITYIVTKTNIATGCTDDDDVTVTVSNAAVTANAGADFTKTCTANTSGQTIGEASDAAFTYSWTPAAGLTATNVSNPTANPASTTTYTVTKTNIATGCFDDDDVTVTVSNAAVTANAGSDFTKTCTANTSGQTIGEASDAAFTYSWTPATGLSATNVSNPTANPASTTTYTVTKTNIATGCFDDDDVTVTVSNAAVTANAGSDFTKTCVANTSGQTIGEANDAAFTYSWSPATGLSATNVSNPTANPASTTTYTVRKTNIATGCFDDDDVTVTVNTTPPTFTVCLVQPTLCANSGSVTITASGGSGFSYSINGGADWSESNLFSDLGSGSVTGIKVKNSDGCISEQAACDAQSVCPEQTLGARSASSSTKTIASTTITTAEVLGNEVTVKAFPNPYDDKVRLVVSSPVTGYGSIEVVNMLGQKVKTVYQGRINVGNQAFDMSVPAAQRATLIYIFRMGGKQITGKLLQLKQ